MMQEYFYDLAARLVARLQGDEVLTMSFSGEASDFVRLNHNLVRQAGHVRQQRLGMDLIAGRRHAAGACTLSGNVDLDVSMLVREMEMLRAQRELLPEDPYLHYATQVCSTEHAHVNALPDSAAALETLMQAAQGLDLVGLFASGVTYRGFANSLGQRNWHSSATFNLDWSCYHERDKAVKASYAGFDWDEAQLHAGMDNVREQLTVMGVRPKSISPGRYRAFLAPAAMQEILDMMSWGGFGLKSHRTAQTPLIKMVKEGRPLHPAITLIEDHARGVAPAFTDTGFVTPAPVVLIEGGNYRDCLVSPRSAQEYGVALNSGEETPNALDLAGGGLPAEDVLRELGTGLYINNLWYCNFSDRNDCRITGMTRFACFWVQDGRIQAPLDVMRFDESVYHLLGDRLLALSEAPQFIFDPSSYEQRSTRSYRLPGALVEDMTFTL